MFSGLCEILRIVSAFMVAQEYFCCFGAVIQRNWDFIFVGINPLTFLHFMIMVICPERGADLHLAQLMPLPLTVSCSSKSRLISPSWFYLSGTFSPG